MENKRGQFTKGCIPWNKGKKCTEEEIAKMNLSGFAIGHANGHPCWGGEGGRFKVGHADLVPKESRGHTEETRLKIGKSSIGKHVGEKSFLWKGGVSPIHKMIRGLQESKNWRKSVFERDNYTCQACMKRGVKLDPHHLKRFSIILNEFLKLYSQFSPIEDKETLIKLAVSYPEFWNIDNGQTLCRDCHNKTKGLISKHEVKS